MEGSLEGKLLEITYLTWEGNWAGKKLEENAAD